MKRILSALLVLMLAFAAPAALSGQPFARDYAAMNEAAASALILTAYDKDGNETVTCSGFIAFDDSHAVTTWAAVSQAASLKVVADDGTDLGETKVLGCDSDCNLAILAFGEPTGLQPLAFNESGEVRRGASCVSIGAQDGVNAINTGNISNSFSAEGLDLIQFTAPVAEGVSGSALLNENGLVAGVTMFGLSGEIGYTVVQNMNFALSVRHVTELWDYCRDDEPVELSNWGITDIGVHSDEVSDLVKSREVTLVNDSGYSVTDFRVNVGRSSVTLGGWFKNGETATLDLAKLGDDPETVVEVIFYMRVSGRSEQFNVMTTLGELWEQTYSIEAHSGYGVKPDFVRREAENAPSSERRHIKEAVQTEESFTIPETIEREHNLEKNTCIIINDTKFAITYITMSAEGVYVSLLSERVEPGEFAVVELPERFVNNGGKLRWKFRVGFDSSAYGSWSAWLDMDTKNEDELCGQILHAEYDEKTRQFSFAAHPSKGGDIE